MDHAYRTELLAALRKWHDNDKHERIIQTVEKIDRNEWDYDIAGCCYARALNNVGRYEEALALLLSLREEGENDCYWYFRVGYSLYYLKREAEAAKYFKEAVDRGDQFEDTIYLLRRSLIEALVKEDPFNPLPLLQGAETAGLFNAPWDFLFVFLYKYFRVLGVDGEDNLSGRLTFSQRILVDYYTLDRELRNGGFIQLIHNGCGDFIFNPLFSKAISGWGAKKIAGIVKKARVEYMKHKETLEKVMSNEEFSELYENIHDFAPLETRYFAVCDKETENIRRYVEEHISEFCVVPKRKPWPPACLSASCPGFNVS